MGGEPPTRRGRRVPVEVPHRLVYRFAHPAVATFAAAAAPRGQRRSRLASLPFAWPPDDRGRSAGSKEVGGGEGPVEHIPPATPAPPLSLQLVLVWCEGGLPRWPRARCGTWSPPCKRSAVQRRCVTLFFRLCIGWQLSGPLGWTLRTLWKAEEAWRECPLG